MLRCMVHRCNFTCQKDGKCTKHFSKPFAEYTSWKDNETIPKYRRRTPDTGGRQEVVRGQTVDNRWIVPYNLYLLKYRCYINVEACSSVKACKYLFKYKGNDRAIVRNAPANQIPLEACNEISEYQDLRSIGASEACWRLFDFPISSLSPPVISFPVHLEDGQLVYFGQSQARQVAEGPPPKTQLTAWFQYNREHPNDTQHYLYCDIPEHFVWDARDTHWKTR